MTWWKKLPTNLRDTIGLFSAVAVLGIGAFSLGAATESTRDEYRTLPARVEAVEQRVESIDSSLTGLVDDVAEVRCIVRAQALGENQRDCLPIFGIDP